MAEPILQAQNLQVRFNGTPILQGVSLEVGRGDMMSVIGPNGAGKSTLVRCLGGLISPRCGEVSVHGRPLVSYSRRQLARVISYVPQATTPAIQFSVRTFVEMGRYPQLGSWASLRAHDVEAVNTSLEMTETAHLVDRSIGSLSGGERQRVFIAAAIAQGGNVLLLDEPTTFLDYRHQVQIVDLLERLNHERGMTIIAATHDLNHTLPTSDTVLALREGQVVFDGPAVDVIEAERLASIYDTEFTLIPSAAGSPPLVMPARG
jgi:iron complex transport system ATP-binding protein